MTAAAPFHVDDSYRYSRVFLSSWAVQSCAGDARATFSALQTKTRQLEQSPETGWIGRLPTDQSEQISELSKSLCADTWNGIAQLGRRPPWFGMTSSKGDTAAWLSSLPPADPRPQLWPGSLQHGINDPKVPYHIGHGCVAACSTGLSAVLAAADAIEHQQTDRAIAGAVDLSLQELLLAGFRQLGVRCRQAPEAFTGAGTGFAPAEGGAAFGLTSEPSRHAWQIRGGVRLGDASHITGCLDTPVLIACLESLWRILPQPEAIVAHATGTRNGDRYEQQALAAGPWASCPVYTFKPFIGHCLGASGATELGAALEASWGSFWKLSLGFGGHITAIACSR